MNLRQYLTITSILFACKLFAQDSTLVEHCHHHDGVHFSSSPITIMGEHLHSKGDFMFSYRAMNMNMDKLVRGSSTISAEDVYDNGYMVAPNNMTMQMHMLGLMYSPANNITFMGMINYSIKNMDAENRMKMISSGMSMETNYMYSQFSTHSSGVSDLNLSALIRMVNKKAINLHANVGLSLPVGKINQTSNTSMGENSKLPYSMQLGSGSVASILGVTLTGNYGKMDWGVQPKSIVYFNDNNEGYRLGNQYIANVWTAYRAVNWFSFSLGIKGNYTTKIANKDADLNPMMSPMSNTNNTGGTYINGGLGMNFYIYNGFLKGMKIATEGRLPLYYQINGIQMITSSMISVGIQYTISK